MPRTRINAVNKLIPQLREGRLHARTDRSQQRFLLLHIRAPQQQQAGFLGQELGQLRAALTEVANRHATLDKLGQRQRDLPVPPVAGREQGPDNLSAKVGEQVQLEAEEPAFARFAEVGALLAQQTDAAVPQGQTQWQGLGVEQKECAPLGLAPRGFEQLPDETRQLMQAREPSLVAAQVGESRRRVGFDQRISAPQGGTAEVAWHQGDGHDFGVSEVGGGIIGLAPVGTLRMGFEVVVDKHVDFRQVLIYVSGFTTS
jgi:hypothetical protein